VTGFPQGNAPKFLFDNAGMWGACKEKEGRERGRTGAGAVKREEEVGNGVCLSDACGSDDVS